MEAFIVKVSSAQVDEKIPPNFLAKLQEKEIFSVSKDDVLDDKLKNDPNHEVNLIIKKKLSH